MSDQLLETRSALASTVPQGRQLQDAGKAERKTTGRNIIALTLAEFFSAVRGEIITPLRMVFLVTVLQTPLPVAGLIEGLANGVGGLARIASRRVARLSMAPKARLLLGYGISNAVMPLLAVASSWLSALAITLVTAAGQGIRRDPLESVNANPSPQRGWGRVMTAPTHSHLLGAAAGALVSTLLLLLEVNDLQQIFAWAAVPGALALLALLLVRGSGEKLAGASPSRLAPASIPLTRRKLKLRYSVAPLGVRFWMFLGISTLFALGNVSAGFFVLRLAGLEQSLMIVMLIYFGHRLVAALLAPALGRLHERWGAMPVLITAFTGLGLLYVGWAFSSQTWLAGFLLLAYGAYIALSLGASDRVIADLAPSHLRVVAQDWYSGVTGLATVAANVIAGWFWIVGGPKATFMYGACVVALAVALIVAWMPWLRRGYPEL